MFTAIARILRTIHIIPPAKVDPVRKRPSATKGETAATPPGGATVKAAPVNRDDTRKDVRKVEPAMAGIPRDADQRTPRVASPGLPPVDPVVAAHAARMLLPAEEVNARSPVTAPFGVEARPESSTRPSEPMEPGFVPRGKVQAPVNENSCRNVAGHGGGYPCENQSDAVAVEGLPEGSPKDWGKAAENAPDDRFPDVSQEKPIAYEHPDPLAAKDGDLDFQVSEEVVEPGAVQIPDPPGEAPDRTIDSRAGDRLHRVETPAKRSTRVPPRIADRPRMEEWADDELLTLPEAAALFWPDGPITTNTLRTAGHEGTLTITKVAGKFFTTPMAIRRMGVDAVGATARPKAAEAADTSPQALLQMKVAEAKRLGRAHARPRRAAKRSVAPAVTNGRTGQ